MRLGAVILCGGLSRRMGQDKAALPFGPETILQREVRILLSVAEPLVLVAHHSQQLPELPRDPRLLIVRDRVPDQGPLQGLAQGLMAIEPYVDAAYVTSCDVPLLVPAVVERLAGLLGGDDVVVPVDEQYHHPLAAVYRPSVGGVAEQLLAAGVRRPVALFDAVATRRVPVAELRDLDPELLTFMNLNHPEEYDRALRFLSAES